MQNQAETQFLVFLIDFLSQCNPSEGEYAPPSRGLVEWARGYVDAQKERFYDTQRRTQR